MRNKLLNPIFFVLILTFCFQQITEAQTDAKKNIETPTLNGIWNVAIESDRGNRTGTLVFEKNGSKFAGKYVGTESGTDRELTNITLTDNTVAFGFEVEREGQAIEFEFEARLSGQQMTGTWRVFMNQAEAASGAVTAVRQLELSDFRGYTSKEIGAGWSMKDGILHFDGNKCGDLVTKQEFGNFILEFDWKISEAGNSGVMYRVSLGDKKPYKSGPEYQILDDDKHKDGKLESHRAGALYALYIPNNKTLNPVGQWNSSKIVLNGNSVQHWLNGKKVVEAELGSKDWNEKVNASKFKTWEKFGKNKTGHLCFQDHGDPVWYRNITIKPMD
ncbi:DUF1080 domain-containing protein [bacterium]|nr:DUF1080 domain-containing protein [bacterium]